MFMITFNSLIIWEYKLSFHFAPLFLNDQVLVEDIYGQKYMDNDDVFGNDILCKNLFFATFLQENFSTKSMADF